MAQFCTKCGAPLTEGLKFCTGCGATVGEPSAPAVQAPAAAYSPAPATPGSAPRATSSGSPVVKIILIVLAVLILLGMVSAASCVYFVYRAKQKVRQFEKQTGVTFPMPTGAQQVPTPSAAPGTAPSLQTGPVVDTGIPVYPGATPSGGGGQMSLGTNTVKTQTYTTSDSVDKVVAFYKEKLGPTAMVTQSGGQAAVQLAGANGVTTIGISTDSSTGKTKISIGAFTK